MRSKELFQFAPRVALATIIALGGSACSEPNTQKNALPPLEAKVDVPHSSGYIAVLQDGTKVTLTNGTPVEPKCDVTLNNGWGIHVVIEGGEFKGQTTDIPRHDLDNTNNPYDPTNKSDPFGALDGCVAPTPTIESPSLPNTTLVNP
jgi:hypothetical protein